MNLSDPFLKLFKLLAINTFCGSKLHYLIMHCENVSHKSTI